MKLTEAILNLAIVQVFVLWCFGPARRLSGRKTTTLEQPSRPAFTPETGIPVGAYLHETKGGWLPMTLEQIKQYEADNAKH